MTTAAVTSPGELETALLHALIKLPRPTPRSASAENADSAIHRRVWTIPTRVPEFTGRDALLTELRRRRGRQDRQ